MLANIKERILSMTMFMYMTIQSLNLIKYKTESKTKSGTSPNFFPHLFDRLEVRAYD